MFRRCWRYVSSIGIRDEYDDILIRRILLTNQFNAIAILVFLFTGINHYVLGDINSAIIVECLVLVSLVTFFLNKLGFYKFSTSFLVLIVSTTIFYFDSHSGLLSGVFLFHFPLVLALAYVFDIKEEKKIILFHFSVIIIFLFINVLTHYSLFKADILDDAKRAHMFLFNLLLSVSSVGFFVFIMIQNNLKERQWLLNRIEERKQSEKMIKEALSEKNILIAELHHRVKNNLAIISGLFSLKITDDLHEDAKNVLLESRNRVRSMALIHNRLYNSDNLTDVDFGEYAKELIEEINASYPAVANSVKINTVINNVSLNINSAIPCGLILNELLTNSYKHAFKDKSDGQIQVSFVNDNNTILMTVNDNGIGLPTDYKQKQSLGVTVIESLSEQLDGSFNFSNNNGTCFELKFKHN